MTFIAARLSAEPPTAMEREPNVPERDLISVALDDLDARHRNAEPRCDDLREGRGVALGADERLHAAILLHADCAASKKPMRAPSAAAIRDGQDRLHPSLAQFL